MVRERKCCLYVGFVFFVGKGNVYGNRSRVRILEEEGIKGKWEGGRNIVV